MRDANRAGEPLHLVALLYASGELEAAEAADFERRLAEDQTARDALAGAVPLALALAGRAPALPDPGYRARVRRQLWPAPGLWQRLWAPRPYRGHPVLWGAVGAAAAAVVALALFHWAVAPAVGLPAPLPAEQKVASLPAAGPIPSEEAVEAMANVWAELNTPDHLMKVHEEELRRKVRAEERARGARDEERRSRPLSGLKPRH